MVLRRIILIVLWGLFLMAVTFVAFQTETGRWDFITYHYNAERITAGEPLYGGYDQSRFDYIYPPLLAQVIAPFTPTFSLNVISMVWHVLSIAMLLLSVVLVNRTVSRPKQRFVFWLMPLLFIPDVQSFWVGQISMVLLGCFTIAWYAYRTDRPYLAGIVLALATWLKVYPVFLIIYFMWKRDWKIVGSAFVAGLLLGVLQILLSDLDTLMTYFTTVLPGLANNGQIIGLFKNSSILGFTFKLFTDTPDIIPLVDSPTLARVTRWILTILVVGGSALLITRHPKQKIEHDKFRRFDLEYGLVLLVSLLFGATLWVSGMSPLLLSYWLILKQPLQSRRRLLVWLSFALTSLYFIFLLAFQPGNKLPALILSMGFYGVFVLWILYVQQLWKVIRAR